MNNRDITKQLNTHTEQLRVKDKEILQLRQLVNNLTTRMGAVEVLVAAHALTLVDHEARLTDGNPFV